MSGITTSDVVKLAELARLRLTDDEISGLARDVSSILTAVESMQSAVSDDTPATSHPIPMTNVMRPDEPRDSLPHDAAMAGAPAADEGRFRVPRILDED